MIGKYLPWLLIILCVISIQFAIADQPVVMEDRTISTKIEGWSFMGAGLTEEDAGNMALLNAKRDAIKRIESYLKSNRGRFGHKVADLDLYTYAMDLLKVKILGNRRAIKNNMFTYVLEIEASVDLDILTERAGEIRRNRHLRSTLEAERERIDGIFERISSWDFATITSRSPEVHKTVNSIKATEWFDKGMVVGMIPRMGLAMEFYKKAVRLDPEYVNAFNNIGLIHYEAGDYDKAIESFTTAIEIDSSFALALKNRGRTYAGMNRHRKAIDDYNSAIDADSGFAEAFCLRGKSFLDLEQYQKSCDDLSSAIRLSPDYPEAYNYRGRTLRSMGNIEDAISDFSASINQNPGYADAYLNRGMALAETGKHKQAIQDFTRAIEIDPRLTTAYVQRGLSYRELGKTEQEINDYTRAIEIDSTYAMAYYCRGITLLNSEYYSAAAGDLNRYLKLHGRDDEIAEKVRRWIEGIGHTPRY